LEAKNALDHEESIRVAAAERRAKGQVGSVTMAKLGMFHKPKPEPGVKQVRPNFKHELKTLSPKFLGPVKHHEPGVPEALTIENFHQFSKVFPHELDQNKLPCPDFFKTRDSGFKDPVPHRHKLAPEKIKALRTKAKGSNAVNIPSYAFHVRQDGTDVRLSYVGSRALYSIWYEHLAPQQEHFRELKALLQDGVSICLVGYDGWPVTRPLAEHYEDTRVPFGHEAVLLCLLTLSPENFPWRQYIAAYPEVYRGLWDPVSNKFL
jgi:hypothetical protein